MTEQKKKLKSEPFSLEDLNQQFSRNIKKKKKRKKEIPGIWMVILLVVVVLIVVLVMWKVSSGAQSDNGNTADSAAKTVTSEKDAETYNETSLSEEEQEKWTTTDVNGENIYVELNSKIYLEGSKAYIRLINPIYSDYYYSITIYPEAEEDTLLYQSEKISPGTILEAAMLTSEPTEEQYSAVVKYRIYDGDGNDLGTHPVNVEFTTDEQYK